MIKVTKQREADPSRKELRRIAFLCGAGLILFTILSCSSSFFYPQTNGPVYVAFGDSLTFGEGDKELADGKGYPPILAKMLSSSNKSYKIYNEGKRGANSLWGEQQIGMIIKKYPGASTILIQFGTNDAKKGVSDSEFELKMQAIVTAIVEAGKKPLLAKIPYLYNDTFIIKNPCEYGFFNPKDAVVNQRVRNYNYIIDRLVDRNNIEIEPGIRFNPPDLNSYFMSNRLDDCGKPSEFADYWHPDNNGYTAMAQLWKQSIRGEGGRHWRAAIGDPVWSSAAVDKDGRVYVGSNGHKLYAFDANGKRQWTYSTGGKVISSPLIGSTGIIYVGSTDGWLHAVRSNDGSVAWKFHIKGAVYSSPAQAADGTIYIGSMGQNCGLYAFNSNGTLKWKKIASAGVRSCPAVGGGGSVYVGAMDGWLYAFDPKGNQLWKFRTKDMVNSSPAVEFKGTVDQTVYVGSLDGYLYAVNAQNGKQKWKQNVYGAFSSPAIGSEGTVYIGSERARIWAFKPDGTIYWEFWTGGSVRSSPAIGADGTIYIGADDYQVYAISPKGKLRWAAPTHGYVYASPTIAVNGRLYVGSSDRYLYAFNIGSKGPFISSWPMFHHDARHTGRTGP